MAYAYAIVNKLAGIGAGSFTWSAGLNDSTRSRLNDVRMDAKYTNGNAASGLTLVLDFGSAVTLTGIALLNHNAAVQKADAAVKVESADDAAITVNPAVRKAASTLYSAASPRNKDHVLQFIAGTARRYWRLTFTWTGTVTSFSLGEIIAFDTQTQLSRKSIYGGGESEEIFGSDVTFDSGGSRGYLRGGPLREVQLPFADLTTAQRDELLAMWRAVKNGAVPFLWIPSYEATAVAAAVAEQEVIYGRCQVPVFKWQENDYQLFTSPEIVIRSLGREVGS